MGPDEREAFKSGVLQRLIQPIEDASGNRNVAQNIIGSEAWRDKLSAILPPRQYRVIKNALEREAELFSKTSGITGQSATANRLAARERLNSLIDQGDIEGAAVELMSYPSGWARMAVRALGKAANLSDRDAVYAKLANMLKQKDKAGIASLVKGLTDREEAIRAGAARRAAVETRGLRTAAAPIGHRATTAGVRKGFEGRRVAWRSWPRCCRGCNRADAARSGSGARSHCSRP